MNERTNERERKKESEEKITVEGSQLYFFSQNTFGLKTLLLQLMFPFSPDTTNPPTHPTSYPEAAGSGMDGTPQGFFPGVRVCLFLWTACMPIEEKKRREYTAIAHTLKTKGVNKMGLSGSGKGNSSSSWLDIPPFPMDWTHIFLFSLFFELFVCVSLCSQHSA